MRYLVESFLPAARGRELPELAARARAVADELAQQGARLRQLEAIYVPEDEMCLLLYEAESAELAREATQRAGIACERVVEATSTPRSGSPRPKGDSP